MGTTSNNGFRDKDTDGDCPNAAWPRSRWLQCSWQRCGRSGLEHHSRNCQRGLQIPVSCNSAEGSLCTCATTMFMPLCTRLRPLPPECQRADRAPSVQTPAKIISVFVADSCL